jgi:hypothetical protein
VTSPEQRTLLRKLAGNAGTRPLYDGCARRDYDAEILRDVVPTLLDENAELRAELSSTQAAIQELRDLRPPTSFNNEADDYGTGWADGAIATTRAYRAVALGLANTGRCACAPDCDQAAEHTEHSPYMDDFCHDCTSRRCDITFHGDAVVSDARRTGDDE